MTKVFLNNNWYNRNYIAFLLNFTENNKFGCNKKCSFCQYSNKNFNIYSFPTDKEIDIIFEKLGIPPSKVFIEISGGGDPLYNFEKNKDKVCHLINYCKAKGVKYFKLSTSNFEVVKKYYNTLLQDITSYSISTEVLSESLADLCNLLYLNQKYVRITKVLNPNSNVDIDYLVNFVNFYTNCSTKIILRENFFNKIPEYIRYKLTTYEEFTIKANIIWKFDSSYDAFDHVLLWLAGDFYSCNSVDDYIENWKEESKIC